MTKWIGMDWTAGYETVLVVEPVVDALPPVDILVVFAIIALALALFVTETLPVDVTAILVLVLLIILEPWTQMAPEDGFLGFSNHATLTVLALFIVSDAIRQTGIIQLIGRKIVSFTGASRNRQLSVIMGLAGGSAGFVNNTPIVAIFIPMVTDIADRTGVSPSKLLIPLSYAAMLGGMLTLIGTAPNLIASEASARLLDRPFTMFEFTQLGAIQLAVGIAFMLVIGHRLIPERIEPEEELYDRYELTNYLAEVVVDEDSALVGRTVSEVFDESEYNIQVVRIRRGDRLIGEPLGWRTIRPEDRLLMRTDRETLMDFVEAMDVRFPDEELDEPGEEVRELAEDEDREQVIAEMMIVPQTRLVGQTLRESRFRQRFDTTVLAVRRGGALEQVPLREITIRGGDTFLVQTTADQLEALSNMRHFVVSEAIEWTQYRRRKAPLAVGITAAVVAIAALGIYPISVAAFGGVVALVVTGCITPSGMYDAVDWNVIFLLAGLIPLGISMERTGAAMYIANAVVPLADLVPVLLFLWVFYMVTALLTELISNVGSIVLMVPVAVEVAVQTGIAPFSMVLVTTFAASTALMTPIGYQTNLMIYNKGGYQFTDFMRVGVPLQLILGVVVAGGVAVFWGV